MSESLPSAEKDAGLTDAELERLCDAFVAANRAEFLDTDFDLPIQRAIEAIVTERLRAVESRVEEGFVVLYDGARRKFTTLVDAQAEAEKCEAVKKEHDRTGKWFAYSPLIKRFRHTWRTDTFETFPLEESSVLPPDQDAHEDDAAVGRRVP